MGSILTGRTYLDDRVDSPDIFAKNNSGYIKNIYTYTKIMDYGLIAINR